MPRKKTLENSLKVSQPSFCINRFPINISKILWKGKYNHTTRFEDFPAIVKQVVEDGVVIYIVKHFLERPHSRAILVPNDILGFGFIVRPPTSATARIYIISD